MFTVGRVSLMFIGIFSITVSIGQVPGKSTKKPSAAVKKRLPVTAPSATKPPNTPASRVRITTDFGDIIVRLYNKTPGHRDNFIKLVKEHFYDSLLFHRVIAGFMIQGGDPLSKNAAPDAMLGRGGTGYTVPAEFDSTLYHKKGALAAARNDNPEKASSGCQFYIVEGKKYSDEELNMIESQRGFPFSPATRMTYKMLGGTPRLDLNYTVFGEVESGIEVVDRIAGAQKNAYNRPLSDIHMKMELLQ